MTTNRFILVLACVMLVQTFDLPVSFSQDMPVGTRRGGRASVDNRSDLVKHFEKLNRWSAAVLSQINHRAANCSVKTETFSDLMAFYDKMGEKEHSKKLSKCVLTRKVVAQLKRIANDSYFESYMATRFPNHETVKREDFIQHCIGDGN